VRRGLIFWRILGLVALVGAVSASAYAVGYAMRGDHRDLEKALVASRRPAAPAKPHSSRSSPTDRKPASKRHREERSRGSVDRGRVVVAVLNATATSGLARSASAKLTAAGFSPGFVGNDARVRETTAVLYARGDRDQALEVAKVARVKRKAVRAMDPGTRALVGADAQVVVAVGSDQASSSK
jgi:LytR cell envelope-related transcriptional attenuator